MNSLLKHGSIMFISVVIANILAYFLQIYFGRVLGPEGYGVFGSLMAILLILSVPIGTIGTVFTKFVSKFKAEENYGKINTLIFASLKKLVLYGIIGFVLISVLSPFIANYLNISSRLPLVFVGIVLIFSVLLPIVRGSLQGLQKFNSLAFNNVFEAFVRLILGVVLIRFGVSGAVLSYGLGYLFAFLIGFLSLKFLFGKKSEIDASEIYSYAYPVLISVVCLSVLLNIPSIFVKHYFSALDAGYWNAALTLAKIIQYIGSGFSIVMFAKVSENHILKKDTKKLLLSCLLYTCLTGVFVIVLFFLFPSLIVDSLFSSGYSGAYDLLKWLGLFVLSYTIFSLFVNYELAIHKTKVFVGLGILSILEIVLIILFHSSLLNVIYILLFVNIVLIALELIRTSNLVLKS